MSDLNNKIIAVTGGSKGFGLAMAEHLLSLGAKVAILSRGQESLDKAKEKLNSEQVFTHTLDVADSAAIKTAFAAINEHFGGLDALINNAGLARVGSTEELRDDEVRLQLDTNILGTVFCCREALPYLRQSENPRIINVSSASAYHQDEMAHLSIYAATKAAVERYSRDLRRELDAENIGVSILRPGGAMDTEFGFGFDFDLLKGALKQWQNQGPISYQGMSAEDVAAAAAYCLAAPPGVSIDLLEVRPNQRMQKPIFE